MAKDIYSEYEGKIPRSLIVAIKREAEKNNLSSAQIKESLDKTCESYERALITPGEDIGIITAESFGEPGTQMSISSNSKIIVKIKDEVRIIEIGDLIDGLMMVKGSFKLHISSEILPIHDLDVYVPSLNNDEKVEWKKVVEVSRHKTDKKLMRLVTRTGREIVATDNHSFVIRKDNKIIPVVGNELVEGERIPVINHLGISNVLTSVSISNIIGSISENLVVNGDMLSKLGSNTKEVRDIIDLDFSTGWLMGAYLSEGFANGYSLSISNVNENYIERAKKFLGNIGLDYQDKTHHRGFSNSRDLIVNSHLLSKFLIVTCGQGSSNKKVPNFAYSAQDKFISGLLRGYFDGDGNFTVSRKMIRSSSNSKELVDGIALLLSRFKIFSYKVDDKKGQYWLLIPYKYAPQFLQQIGSDIDYKLSALQELSDIAKRFWNTKSQDYNEAVSGFGTLFYDVSKRLGLPTRYVHSFTRRQKIGRTALYRHMKHFEMIAKEKNVDISEELAIMRRMFESDVIWDEITEISYVDNDDYVYDLSVPGLETFTTFDGVITHNTLNVFHFAGVSEMQVTQGLPRLIEIFDARETPNKPIINAYLKKEFTKDEKTIRKVASMIKETKLEEISSEFSLNLMKATVEVTLNHEKLNSYGIKIKEINEVLEAGLKGCGISDNGKKIILTPKEGETSFIEVYKLKEKVKSVVVRGIKGISQVLPVRKNNELVIMCAGTNFKDVLTLEAVDAKRTYTNDIHEIAKVLGIEAARQAIINESISVIESQGLDVDIRHILFLADLMTTSGRVKGITRGGITGEKESVLARATFETPLVHLVNASLIGEIDNLNSVIENVIINQPIPLGTGLPGLIAKKVKK